jgi:pilus assembly protein Flp/PilA
MLGYLKTWVALKTDNRGVTMVEYAIMAAIIAVTLVAIVPDLTGGVKTGFGNIATSITTATAK